MTKDSGQLSLHGEHLTYTPTAGKAWSFSLHDVALIAVESTESHGDDRFLWFVLKAETYEPTIHTFGFNEASDELLDHFSIERPSPAAPAIFVSRVLWPKQFAGVPFHQRTQASSITFWGRVLRRKIVESHYHPRVRSFLGLE